MRLNAVQPRDERGAPPLEIEAAFVRAAAKRADEAEVPKARREADWC